MKVSRLKNYIVKRYFNDITRSTSLLLLGPPGIGKSIAVYEAAEEISKKLKKKLIQVKLKWRKNKWVIDSTNGYDIMEILSNPDDYFLLVDHRLSTIVPEDLSGIPRSRNNITFYDPLVWAVMLSTMPGILFLDEFTQINRPDVESASYPLILDKVAGFVEFSKQTMVIAAGNSPEHSSIAHMISTPCASRFKIIKIVPSTVNDWARWMNKKYNGLWDQRVYAFMKRFEDEEYLLKVPGVPETLDAYPCPRTWTWLALELNAGFSSDDDICGLIGYEVGQKLQAFLKVHVDIDSLIKSPESFTALELDGKYMTCIMLATWIHKNKKAMSKSFKLIDTITSESIEYLVLTCLLMKREILNTFLKQLFKYDKKYSKLLEEIVFDLKSELTV